MLSRIVPRISLSPRAVPRVLAPVQVQSVAVPVRTFSCSPVSARHPWNDKGPIAYDELKPLTEQPTGEITIIDVREPNETENGMIPSAVNVPLSQLPKAFSITDTSAESRDFERIYSFPRPQFDSQLIVYCRSGKRSTQAIELLNQRGWTKCVL
ncbi:hypothetical protein MCUN1_000449 [Malassezia cuniculi]|uniref:Rhodanese domain-containing protein n=1 Tax=Malassezia cuniculi TaxID=948313 RepID=A0AAF0ENK4_9BASI|nr:hypothetical protein MCUN1_000449 [Malassezia cuniculi]